MNQPGKLATADEVARRFAVSRGTVRGWVRDGRIPYLRPSRRVVRFDLAAVEAALTAKAADGGAR